MATGSERESDTGTARWRPAAVAASTGLAGALQAYRYVYVPGGGAYAAAAAGFLVVCLVSTGQWIRAR